MGDKSDWYGKSPILPSIVAATSEAELDTSFSSIHKVLKRFIDSDVHIKISSLS